MTKKPKRRTNSDYNSNRLNLTKSIQSSTATTSVAGSTASTASSEGEPEIKVRHSLQKQSNYKVKSLENRSTPPTAQTTGPNWLIFWLVSPHVNTFRGIEAIFKFHPRS